MQQWRDISGFEGLYQISNIGEVMSLGRLNLRGSRLKVKTLKPILGSNGYCNVKLWKDGKPSTHHIHHLVAAHFIGPRPEGMDVCHNDGIRTNNVETNLRYDTHLGNMADRVKHGTLNVGVRNGAAKLDHEKVRTIRALCESGVPQEGIAETAGVTQSVISRIVNRRIWNHI